MSPPKFSDEKYNPVMLKAIRSSAVRLQKLLAEVAPPVPCPPRCGKVLYVSQACLATLVTDRGVWQLDENLQWVSVPPFEVQADGERRGDPVPGAAG